MSNLWRASKQELFERCQEQNAQLIFYTQELDRLSNVAASQIQAPPQAWQKSIKRQRNRLDECRISRDNYKKQLREAIKRIKELEREVEYANAPLEKSTKFFVKFFIHCRKLIKEGRWHYNEFTLLITGFQYERFRLIDVHTDFGFTKHINRDFISCIEKGYFLPQNPKHKAFKRMYWYYMTPLGQERLQEILLDINSKNVI